VHETNELRKQLEAQERAHDDLEQALSGLQKQLEQKELEQFKSALEYNEACRRVVLLEGENRNLQIKLQQADQERTKGRVGGHRYTGKGPITGRLLTKESSPNPRAH
jgi:hypothetical protein